jgi:DNA-binding response OmpR family regulator
MATERILIVEDEKAVARGLEYAFLAEGSKCFAQISAILRLP